MTQFVKTCVDVNNIFEFLFTEIPSELSKCCLACFKRITRRLETVVEGGLAPEPTEEEAARFRSLLREHGTAWDRIAAVSGRTPASWKAFYFTYRSVL